MSTKRSEEVSTNSLQVTPNQAEKKKKKKK